MCLFPHFISGIDKNGNEYGFNVRCGKCIECLQQISSEWALRICLEASRYEENCCITLTYNDVHLPEPDRYGVSPVVKRDIQLFMKRLRKAISPKTVRYFCSGEYGSEKGRPHYHLILFGFTPPDLVYSFSKKGEKYYRSDFIQKLWSVYSFDRYSKQPVFDPIGFVSVGRVTWNTAFYTAKYLQKSVFRNFIVPPFCLMSRNPGLGFNALTQTVVDTGKLYYNGKVYPLPRYFVNLIRDCGFVGADELLATRKALALRKESIDALEPLESKRERFNACYEKYRDMVLPFSRKLPDIPDFVLSVERSIRHCAVSEPVPIDWELHKKIFMQTYEEGIDNIDDFW